MAFTLCLTQCLCVPVGRDLRKVCEVLLHVLSTALVHVLRVRALLLCIGECSAVVRLPTSLSSALSVLSTDKCTVCHGCV